MTTTTTQYVSHPLDRMLDDTKNQRMNARWLAHYQKVKQFVELYGHHRLPFSDKQWETTARWLSLQRTLYKRGKLRQERIELLEMLSISLSENERLEQREHQWNRFFEELQEYQLQHGHFNVPSTSETHRSLAIWVMNQRALYKRNELLLDRQTRLESIGFPFVVRHQKQRPSKGLKWSDYVMALQVFKETYGHTIIKSSYMQDGIPLGSWSNNVRTLRLRGNLPTNREQELTDLGFDWDARVRRWDYKYQELCAFYEREGHLNIPDHHLEREYTHAGKSLNLKLGQWLEKQRQAYQAGDLDPTYQEKLEKFPMDWRLRGERNQMSHWQSQFEKLCQLEDINFFTQDRTHPHHLLSCWATNQRSAYRNGVLDPERIHQLEAVGFVWQLRETNSEKKWQSQLSKWQELSELHPYNLRRVLRQTDPVLFRWAETQRIAFRQGKLTPHRKQKLIEAGFDSYAKRVRSGWYE